MTTVNTIDPEEFDADVAVTDCPPWCEVTDHDGKGKWHAGAVSEVEINETHILRCEVARGEDGELSFDVWGNGSGLTAAQGREFAAAILRAADLSDELGGAR